MLISEKMLKSIQRQQHHILLWTLVFTQLSTSIFGQMYHPDPYKYAGFRPYSIDLEKELIIENDITKATLWKVLLGKDSVTQEDSILVYYVEFNSSGNPSAIHSEYSLNALNSKEIEKLRKKGRLYITDCDFGYDSQNHLVQIKERHVEAYARGDKKADYILNFFDVDGRIVKQKIEERIIYSESPGFLRRKYPNDTMRVEINVNYDSLDHVASIYRTSSGNNHFTANKRTDTINYNCPFDSIFYKKPLHGVEIDSMGRVVQSIKYSTHICGSGGCISPESPYDRILTYHYNEAGKLTKVHVETREGLWAEDEIRTYHENGLPKSIKKTSDNYIQIFEYQTN